MKNNSEKVYCVTELVVRTCNWESNNQLIVRGLLQQTKRIVYVGCLKNGRYWCIKCQCFVFRTEFGQRATKILSMEIQVSLKTRYLVWCSWIKSPPGSIATKDTELFCHQNPIYFLTKTFSSVGLKFNWILS